MKAEFRNYWKWRGSNPLTFRFCIEAFGIEIVGIDLEIYPLKHWTGLVFEIVLFGFAFHVEHGYDDEDDLADGSPMIDDPDLDDFGWDFDDLDEEDL